MDIEKRVHYGPIVRIGSINFNHVDQIDFMTKHKPHETFYRVYTVVLTVLRNIINAVFWKFTNNNYMRFTNILCMTGLISHPCRRLCRACCIRYIPYGTIQRRRLDIHPLTLTGMTLFDFHAILLYCTVIPSVSRQQNLFVNSNVDHTV